MLDGFWREIRLAAIRAVLPVKAGLFLSGFAIKARCVSGISPGTIKGETE